MIPHHYIRNAWYAAGLSDEFAADDLQGHRIAGRPVLVWRSRDGTIGAFDNRCAHKRMPLSEGRVLENGIDVETCCEQGYCGTCMTRYLEGEPEHRDEVLDDEDRESYVLICCARCRTEELVLDL